MMRRAALIAALVLLGLTLMSPSAQAHALLKSSEPADGSQLQKSPSAVLLTFTEDPDPARLGVDVPPEHPRRRDRGPAGIPA